VGVPANDPSASALTSAIVLRYVPLAAILAVIALGVGWRAAYHRYRYGPASLMLFRSTSWPERIQDGLLLLLPMILMVDAITWGVGARSTLVLTAPWNRTGATLVVVGTVVLVRAQSDLGASWRIGIDRSTRPGLVVGGIYKMSRNPIYLGLLTALIGVVLLMPTVVALGVLMASVVIIRQRVRQEEEYLLAVYEGDFRSYAARVGRFVPWVGRL
jgi:protein-S-isoprenylcysteine O-methyltransferase Ste14